MNELILHVNDLFRKYPKTKKNEELKAEILGNLQAKAEDLMESGLSRSEAIRAAIEGMQDVSSLVEEVLFVDEPAYRLEYSQDLLLMFLIGWILSIPFGILRTGLGESFVLFLCAVISGIFYLIYGNEKRTQTSPMIKGKNYAKVIRRSRILWALWFLYILMQWATTTALHFGSNLWFSRPIHIDGPYQFAMVASRYLLPLFTIVLPLSFQLMIKLLEKHKAGEPNEK